MISIAITESRITAADRNSTVNQSGASGTGTLTAVTSMQTIDGRIMKVCHILMNTGITNTKTSTEDAAIETLEKIKFYKKTKDYPMNCFRSSLRQFFVYSSL